MVVAWNNLGHDKERARRIVVLLDERKTKSWIKLAKTAGWPDAGELLRQSALTGIAPAIGVSPDISSRIEATTSHAVNAS